MGVKINNQRGHRSLLYLALSDERNFRYDLSMRSAILNGVVGTALVFLVGIRVLGLSPPDLVVCILATQAAALVSLFFILKMERVIFVRQRLINRSLKTWILFLGVYFGVSLLLGRPLREPKTFLWLSVPLMLTTGFAIIVFGPIQDFFVGRNQRRAASLEARKSRKKVF